MYNSILIKQPSGLGDIFFLQKLVYYLHKNYDCQIVWPVLTQFLYIKDYLKYDYINFVDINSQYDGKTAYIQNQLGIYEYQNHLVIPIQYAEWSFPNISVMEAKYKFFDLGFKDWADYFSFERNLDRENELFYNILKLKDNSKYTLINRKYGSPPDSKNSEYIDITKFSNFIEMDYIDGINLFDWCKVIENANVIHTVDTSINYLIDKLKVNAELYLYSRFNPPNYTHIKNIFSANWIFN